MATPTTAPVSRRTVSRVGLAIVFAGALIQFLLGGYYLAMAHSPKPHDLPVGIVATAEQQAQIVPQLEADGSFAVDEYADGDALVMAIKERKAYGGAVLTATDHTLYVASAASPAVANLLRSAYTKAHGDQVASTVKQVTAAGRPVDAATLQRLTAPPTITDVVPLPKDDSAGSSLSFIIQTLALGGSIASIALGRLGKITERSLLRGLGHAGLLLLYAALSAGVALVATGLFGVSSGADHWALFGGLALTSLAITASVAAAVALVGPAGTLLGALYFTLGLIISGASIAPEMLPTGGRLVGQLLPPGAAATVVRDSLYFPDAASGGPLVVLALFAGIGLLIVLATNAFDYRRPWERAA